MNHTDTPELMKPHEVAVTLDVSTATIYRMITSGALPHVNVGPRKATRILRSDVSAYLTSANLAKPSANSWTQRTA